jgi:chromosome segregation ATPase
MESRLASQDGQLKELEIVLKSKSDEVKYLREERNQLNDELEGCKVEISEMGERLATTEEKLEQATSEIARLTAEIAAAEAIIQEQSLTESSLTSQANSFKEEIKSNRHDIVELFKKIEGHKAKELSHISEASDFVSELTESRKYMLDNVSSILDLSKSQSVDLCSGIAEMLEKSKRTCSVLTECIEKALTSMLNGTTAAKSLMQSSCTNLQDVLLVSNQNSVSELNTMKTSLSLWLLDVENSMNQMTVSLVEQHKKVILFK